VTDIFGGIHDIIKGSDNPANAKAFCVAINQPFFEFGSCEIFSWDVNDFHFMALIQEYSRYVSDSNGKPPGTHHLKCWIDQDYLHVVSSIISGYLLQ
jgi:hypothetical protein